MRHAGNFHPEWGYLAPAPDFIRTARVVLVATAIGVAAGAGVTFSLVAYPTTETSVSARTLVNEVATACATSAELTSGQSPTQRQSRSSAVVASQLADAAASQLSTSSTRRAPEGVLALAEIPTGSGDAPVKIGAAAPAPAAKVPVADPAPIKMKSTKTLNSTLRYASRGEPLQLAPDRNYRRRSLDGYYETGAQRGYHRGRSGGWSYRDEGRPYQVW